MTQEESGTGPAGKFLEHSILYQSLRALHQHSTTSRLFVLGNSITTWIRRSYLYRWLTTEPEPEVIVIDLRETWTVGPIIRILDRVIDSLGRIYAHSKLQEIVQAIEQLFLRAPIRLVSGIFGLFIMMDLVRILLGISPSMTQIGVRAALGALALMGLTISQSWDELLETRAVQLVVKALEPPEPPE